MRHTKLILAGLTATVFMAFAVTSASANRLSITNHNFRVVWTSLEFQGTGGGFAAVLCPVTLEGSFHYNTIVKSLGALIGHVSRASVNSAGCTGGRATVLTASLPWHVQYQGFSGRLPNIERVRLLLANAAFLIEVTAILHFFCLSRTSVEHPAAGEANVEPGGNITSLQPDPANNIPTVSGGGGGCPEPEGRFNARPGDGQVTLLGNTQRIKITLI
jgi:hypothetical protein